MAKLNFTKQSFETKDAQGNVIKLAVKPPDARILNKAKVVYAVSFKDYFQSGVMLMAEVDAHLQERKIWTEADTAEFNRLVAAIEDGEAVTKMKKPTKRSVARAAAIKMSNDRQALNLLTSVRNPIEAQTCEAMANDDQFDYLVAACTVCDDTGKPYFCDKGSPGVEGSLGAYRERAAEEAAQTAAGKLSEAMNGPVKDSLLRLPEVAFLLKHKMMDEDFNFIDEDGNKVDAAGRPIVVEQEVSPAEEEPECPFLPEDGDEVPVSVDADETETPPEAAEAATDAPTAE